MATGGDFDEVWYRKTYPDIARAVEAGVFKSAYDHYLLHGRSEGRFPKPKDPDFILHIGPHKTGTTYIQSAFKALQKDLLQYHIVYPRIWWLDISNATHYQLFKHLQKTNVLQLERDFAELRRMTAERIVISSEDLSDLSLEEISLLKKLTSPSRVTVILYYRCWADRLISAWKEAMHHGHSTTLPHFIASHLSCPSISNQMNIEGVIVKYREVFGAENIKIVSFEELRNKNIDLFAHFARTFLNLVDFEWREKPVNVSLSWPLAELARLLNAISGELWPIFRDKQALFDVSQIIKFMEMHWSSLEVHEDDPLLDSIQKKNFSEFGQMLVDPRPHSRFFPPKIKSVRYINQDYLLESGVAKNIEILVQALRNHG